MPGGQTALKKEFRHFSCVAGMAFGSRVIIVALLRESAALKSGVIAPPPDFASVETRFGDDSQTLGTTWLSAASGNSRE